MFTLLRFSYCFDDHDDEQIGLIVMWKQTAATVTAAAL